MNSESWSPDSELRHKLKWLIFFRVFFSSLLLGSTVILQLGRTTSSGSAPFLVLYGLIAAIFLLSFVYSLVFYRIRRPRLFGYIQIAMDTVAVTFIVFLTGGFASLFTFLYLVVIIYASMILFRPGSMVMAAVCSIQYGVLVDLEYYGWIQPFGPEVAVGIAGYAFPHILYRIVVTMMACFAVAFLSGLLAEQTRRTKIDLELMEAHVKRVERMAAIGEMAAGLAHELKNPLASLRGSIQLLKENLQPEPSDEKLMTIILREADRLNILVSDFLLFAKPPRGQRRIIEMGQVVGDTVALFSRDNAKGGAVTYVKEIEPELWVEMDPDHLRQILWNLLLNAVQAVGEKGCVEIRGYPERSDHVHLTVRDDGIGMSPETVKMIFNPFFTTKPNGTGLGLSIVHRILESYDGRLDVETQPGRGTQFTLKVKRAAPPERLDTPG